MKHHPSQPPVIFDMGEPPEYRCDMAVKALRDAIADAVEMFGREATMTLVIDEMCSAWRRIEDRKHGH